MFKMMWRDMVTAKDNDFERGLGAIVFMILFVLLLPVVLPATFLGFFLRD